MNLDPCMPPWTTYLAGSGMVVVPEVAAVMFVVMFSSHIARAHLKHGAAPGMTAQAPRATRESSPVMRSSSSIEKVPRKF